MDDPVSLIFRPFADLFPDLGIFETKKLKSGTECLDESRAFQLASKLDVDDAPQIVLYVLPEGSLYTHVSGALGLRTAILREFLKPASGDPPDGGFLVSGSAPTAQRMQARKQ
ncbi:MAG: hypothetical protein LAP21_27605 [Acidobacteriia bacterium]|nr:hypothetical protein [Terriglobia bacterium]